MIYPEDTDMKKFLEVVKLFLFGNEPDFFCQCEDSPRLAVGYVYLKKGIKSPAVLRNNDLRVVSTKAKVWLPEIGDWLVWDGARWV
ncbi:MAG: hypothetical protein RL292_501 [Candidatus Parcubacteria bacterium]|jgi:hypothetical protein